MCQTIHSDLVHYGELSAHVRVSHSFERPGLEDLGVIVSFDMPNGTMFQVHATEQSLVDLAAKILNELDNIKQEAAANG
jgi:hypothetical protein